MAKIIVDKSITDSPWHVVGKDAVYLDASHILLPLATYLGNRALLADRSDVGVWLDADEEAEALEAVVSRLPVIALNFGTFFDGRPLSNAIVIRRRFGYTGELRAIGDVRRDQLDQMWRCGINAFQMAEGQDLDEALASLGGFTYNYQSSANRPEPLFRSHRRRQTT